jgi:hypothetical protein
MGNKSKMYTVTRKRYYMTTVTLKAEASSEEEAMRMLERDFDLIDAQLKEAQEDEFEISESDL